MSYLTSHKTFYRGYALIAHAFIVCLFFFISTSVFAANEKTTETQEKVRIELFGVDEALRKNILNNLSLQQEKKRPQLNEARIRRLFTQSQNEIQQALQPFGYYDAIIEATLQKEKKQWVAYYTINPGLPIIISSIQIDLEGEGATDEILQKKAEAFPLKIGDQFTQEAYENFKLSLTTLTESRGYFNARFIEHQVRIDTKARSADIRLISVTGPRYRYGKIRFIQDTYDEAFLQRFLKFHTGEPYLASDLVSLQAALTKNNYFKTVEILPKIREAVETETDNSMGIPAIPVDITLIPSKPLGFDIGAGYGTDTGIRGLFNWEWRRVTDTGHRIENTYRISEYEDTVEFGYIIPGSSPSTDQFAFTGGYIDDRYLEDLHSTIRQLSASYLRGDPLNGLQQTYSLNYQHENYDDIFNFRESTLYMPSIRWEMTRTNNRFNAENGYQLLFEVRGASSQFGSTTDFLQADSFAKYIKTITPYHRLIVRGNFGATQEHDLNALPPSLRFFAGGDNSVRGYAYESLGPTVENEQGNTIVEGGLFLLVGSVEIEQKITGKWYAAAFYDVGNAMNDVSEELMSGAGLGIRWQSPIGPVRIDVAEALSYEGHPWRLHVNIGPDF